MSITYDFSGKTAVITGSARGIGRRIAERFYEAGANVALCSISPNGKEELMQEIAGDDRSRIIAKPVDMTQVPNQGLLRSGSGKVRLIRHPGEQRRNLYK